MGKASHTTGYQGKMQYQGKTKQLAISTNGNWLSDDDDDDDDDGDCRVVMQGKEMRDKEVCR